MRPSHRQARDHQQAEDEKLEAGDHALDPCRPLASRDVDCREAQDAQRRQDPLDQDGPGSFELQGGQHVLRGRECRRRARPREADQERDPAGEECGQRTVGLVQIDVVAARMRKGCGKLGQRQGSSRPRSPLPRPRDRASTGSIPPGPRCTRKSSGPRRRPCWQARRRSPWEGRIRPASSRHAPGMIRPTGALCRFHASK